MPLDALAQSGYIVHVKIREDDMLGVKTNKATSIVGIAIVGGEVATAVLETHDEAARAGRYKIAELSNRTVENYSTDKMARGRKLSWLAREVQARLLPYRDARFAYILHLDGHADIEFEAVLRASLADIEIYPRTVSYTEITTILGDMHIADCRAAIRAAASFQIDGRVTDVMLDAMNCAMAGFLSRARKVAV